MNFNNKNVTIRVDFNVPIDNMIIKNSLRIDSSIPTILACIKGNPKRLILISHLGRPKGKYDENLSLKIILPYLEKKLKRKIGFSNLDDVNNNSNKIILLENIRFYPEEEAKIIDDNVLNFRSKLTQLCDIYINDAFGCSHRSHSSIVGINCPIKIPGLLLKREVEFLSNKMDSGKKPVLAIIGGAKVKDKIQLLKNLIPKVDNIIIGGGMAFTFLKKNGFSIGDSLFDEDGYKIIDEIYKIANNHKTNIYLPIDFVVSDKFCNNGNIKLVNIHDKIDDGCMGLDIGPETIKSFVKVISYCKTIIWNGPMGVFEWSNFEQGTFKIAEYLANVTKPDVVTIIGGGDTVSCVCKFNFNNCYTHLSTGGGASLKLLEGNELVGIKGLM